MQSPDLLCWLQAAGPQIKPVQQANLCKVLQLTRAKQACLEQERTQILCLLQASSTVQVALGSFELSSVGCQGLSTAGCAAMKCMCVRRC